MSQCQHNVDYLLICLSFIVSPNFKFRDNCFFPVDDLTPFFSRVIVIPDIHKPMTMSISFK
jgi:hypothetical protein